MGFHPATCLSNLQADTMLYTHCMRTDIHRRTHTHTHTPPYICSIPRETQHELIAYKYTPTHTMWQWVAQTLPCCKDTQMHVKINVYTLPFTDRTHTIICMWPYVWNIQYSSALCWHLLMVISLPPSLSPFVMGFQGSWIQSRSLVLILHIDSH